MGRRGAVSLDRSPPTCTNLPLESEPEGPLLFSQAGPSSGALGPSLLSGVSSAPFPIASAHLHAPIVRPSNPP